MKKLLVQEEMQVAREEQIKHKLHFQAIQGNSMTSFSHSYSSESYSFELSRLQC